jgi:UDP-glucose 4-epimerase
MKVLVTGGTGFVGKHLVRLLINRGALVRMLVRKTSTIEEFKKMGVEFVYGDITDKSSLHRIVEDIDIVYHLAAQMGNWRISDRRFYAVNVEGTMNVLEASLSSNIRQFVFCSTPGVQGKGHRQAPETLQYKPPYAYEATKCQAEKLALRFYEKHGVPVTVIRPDFVYGPGDMRRLPLYRAIKKKRFCVIGDGRSVLHPTYIEDVIQGFYLVAGNPLSFGEIYNIAGPRLVTVKDYVHTIAKNLGVSPPRLRIAKPIALIAAYILEGMSHFTGKEPYVSRSKIEFLTRDHGCDISKAKNQVGYEPVVNLQVGIQQTVDWYYRSRLI